MPGKNLPRYQFFALLLPSLAHIASVADLKRPKMVNVRYLSSRGTILDVDAMTVTALRAEEYERE